MSAMSKVRNYANAARSARVGRSGGRGCGDARGRCGSLPRPPKPARVWLRTAGHSAGTATLSLRRDVAVQGSRRECALLAICSDSGVLVSPFCPGALRNPGVLSRIASCPGVLRGWSSEWRSRVLPGVLLSRPTLLHVLYSEGTCL